MKKIFAIAISTLIVLACSKSKDAEQPQACAYDSCAIKAPASEIQAVQQYLATNNITATQHCSGLFYRVETMGSGMVTPTACSYISAKYKGSLANGNVFDQNTLDYPLSSLVKGWVNGLPYIRTGGKIHLYIPPSLGYGATDVKQNGVVVIPGNSVLIFEVELLNVR